jgi:hypothetical protein
MTFFIDHLENSTHFESMKKLSITSFALSFTKGVFNHAQKLRMVNKCCASLSVFQRLKDTFLYMFLVKVQFSCNEWYSRKAEELMLHFYFSFLAYIWKD